MNTKRFNNISEYYRSVFGGRVYKLSLDIGATCPNRDGTIGCGGCIFCSGKGSGDFAEVDMQLGKAVELLGEKASGKYIAYFQSFTNTYMPVERLSEYVDKALAFTGVVGVSISTRPDCITREMYDYLSALNERTHLVIELGMQTTKDSTLKIINRGHNFECFKVAFNELKRRNIKVCVHIMNGLPSENREDMLENIRVVSRLKPHSVKLHCTYVVEGTALCDMYRKGEFDVMTFEEYIDILVEQIRLLDKSIYIERLTGDGDRRTLIAPLWTLSKRYFLNSLDKKLIELDARQGDLCGK